MQSRRVLKKLRFVCLPSKLSKKKSSELSKYLLLLFIEDLGYPMSIPEKVFFFARSSKQMVLTFENEGEGGKTFQNLHISSFQTQEPTTIQRRKKSSPFLLFKSLFKEIIVSDWNENKEIILGNGLIFQVL